MSRLSMMVAMIAVVLASVSTILIGSQSRGVHGQTYGSYQPAASGLVQTGSQSHASPFIRASASPSRNSMSDASTGYGSFRPPTGYGTTGGVSGGFGGASNGASGSGGVLRGNTLGNMHRR